MEEQHRQFYFPKVEHDYRSFVFSKDPDGVATIRLNRPEKLNPISLQVYNELARATENIARDNDIRVVIITGTGRAFCAGGDVNDINSKLVKSDPEGLLDFTRMTCRVTKGFIDLKRPVIAAINGLCCGAGAVIALGCDMRIAAESARFAFLFNQVGLAGMDMGAGWLLPKIVGLGNAYELLYTGDWIESKEALRIGLVNRVVPDDQLMVATRQFVDRLLTCPQMGLKTTKETLHKEISMDMVSALELEAEAQALCMGSHDFKEAYQAWVEKRKPNFVGR